MPKKRVHTEKSLIEDQNLYPGIAKDPQHELRAVLANATPDDILNDEFGDPDLKIEKQQEIFMRGIVHDVNNNLMAVMAACDHMDSQKNVKPQEMTDVVRAHVKSISSLMRDLMANRDMDAPMRMDQDELKVFLKGILPSLSLVAGKDTRVELGDFNVPAVRVHPLLLHRVLLQLVRNVSELEVEHPLSFITARRHEDWCEISVSDNGPGVQEADRKDIFASGFMTKGKPGSRGYGLSAVAWAVDTWEGEYGVESIKGDNGCRFWVRLPLCSRLKQS